MKNIFLIIASLSFALVACRESEKAVVESAQNAPFCLNEQLKKSTRIVDISQQNITEQITLSGKVEYNENDLVAVKSVLQGVVQSVKFELGDYVKNGQVLATIQSIEIQSIAQEKRQYQNQLELLKKQLQTKRELLKDGLSSIPEITDLEYQLQATQIALDKANAVLQMYRAAGDGQFNIVAPKDGYIVQKNMSIGQAMNTDNEQPLFSISNLKEVWVMVNIYPNNLKYVKTGAEVLVTTVAYPDRNYKGTIDKIYNVFDDNEHVIKARVVLNNQDLQLLPGLVADIIITKEESQDKAYAIPNNALVFSNNKEYVVVYKNDCELEAKQVMIIGKNATHTYVAEKFNSTDKVITSNALLIYSELTK